MHDGCTGNFQDGKMIIDKIRMMGFNKNPIPNPITIKCIECNNEFQMTHLETKCPNCNMVYGVTPCSVSHPDRIKPSAINY